MAESLDFKRPIWILLALGVVSGALEVVYGYFDLPALRVKIGDSETTLAPGVIYGVFLGAGLSWLTGLRGPRFVLSMALVALLVTLAWYVPTRLATEIHRELTENMIVIGFLMGALGAAMVAGSTALLFDFLRRWRPALIVVAIGAVAGMLLGLEEIGDETWAFGLFLFPIWQGAVSAALGRGMAENARK